MPKENRSAEKEKAYFFLWPATWQDVLWLKREIKTELSLSALEMPTSNTVDPWRLTLEAKNWRPPASSGLSERHS